MKTRISWWFSAHAQFTIPSRYDYANQLKARQEKTLQELMMVMWYLYTSTEILALLADAVKKANL